MINIVAIILVLGALGAGTVSLLGDSYWTGFSPGPAFMPYWVAGFGLVVAVLLLVQTIRGTGPREEQPDFSDFPQAGTVIALLLALVLLVPVLGMLVGSVLLMLTFLLVLKRRPLFPSLLATAITAAVVYGVFETWLNVDLPKGMVGL
jgi:hypothetical protein